MLQGETEFMGKAVRPYLLTFQSHLLYLATAASPALMLRM